MARTTSGDDRPRFKGEDDVFYRGTLIKPREGFYKDGDTAAEDYKLRPAIVVEFTVKGSKVTARDTLGISLGKRKDGTVSKLRQLLNALAEKPKDAELWFDAQSLEWGYDMAPNSAAYAQLTEGMALEFRGENRGEDGNRAYRISGYRTVKE